MGSVLRNLFMPLVVNAYYKDRVNEFKMLNEVAKKGDTVLLGDSITDRFRTSEMYYGKRVVNRGIAGDTTYGVLERMKESVYDIYPEKIFVLIGTNDIQRPKYNEDKSAQNIKAIINDIKLNCPKTKIYLESIYPVNPTVVNPDTGKRNNSQINSLNVKIEAISKDMDIEYLKINEILKDKDGRLNAKYTYDGLHLNGYGYKKVLEFLKEYID